MPTVEVSFEFVAYRWDEPPVTDVEFLGPLEIAPGEVEAASSWKRHWGQPFVRIATVKSERPVPDAEFDEWIAPACRAVVRFLRARPAKVFNQLRAAGLQNLRLTTDVTYVGQFPITDWPQDVYDAAREAGIGFVGGSTQLDRAEQTVARVGDEPTPSPYSFELFVPPPDRRDRV